MFGGKGKKVYILLTGVEKAQVEAEEKQNKMQRGRGIDFFFAKCYTYLAVNPPLPSKPI